MTPTKTHHFTATNLALDGDSRNIRAMIVKYEYEPDSVYKLSQNVDEN